MDKSLLVKLIGFPATLIHYDTLVFDRWIWLRRRLPQTSNNEKLLDIGCGTGAFTIGAALRGYHALGLSWDERNQNVADERAKLCKAKMASFEILDVRCLDSRKDFESKFDIAICLETIEHVLNDQKLVKDIFACLKPGGRLLLTTPNYYYSAITTGDNGPFQTVEEGWHVRRGYTPAMLRELCEQTGLICENISYCSGLLSQKTTFLLRSLSRVHSLLGWVAIVPLRIVIPIFDNILTRLTNYPYFSICLEAYKPRYAKDV